MAMAKGVVGVPVAAVAAVTGRGRRKGEDGMSLPPSAPASEPGDPQGSRVKPSGLHHGSQMSR